MRQELLGGDGGVLVAGGAPLGDVLAKRIDQRETFRADVGLDAFQTTLAIAGLATRPEVRGRTTSGHLVRDAVNTVDPVPLRHVVRLVQDRLIDRDLDGELAGGRRHDLRRGDGCA